MKRNAAALLMTREGSEHIEVYLAERASNLKFFGGYHALPGGVRGPEDGADRNGSDEHPLLKCAVRELFEETGICRVHNGEERDVAEMRTGMLAKERARSKVAFTPWVEWIEAEGHEELTPVCRIQTPPFAPVRYDTLFFHVPLADGEAPHIVPGELVSGGFWRPQDALAAWHRGEIRIVPPVLILLEHLVEAEDLITAFAALATTAQDYREGRLHRVRFSPGVVMAPLATETIPPATTTNCYVVGEERLFVIDPGSTDAGEQARLIRLLDEMQGEGRVVEGIVLTHHHPDHIGGVASLSQAMNLPVHAHSLTLNRLPGDFVRGRELVDGDRIDLGKAPDGSDDWHLTCVFTPGHDRGHLCFTESRYGATIVGDMLSTVSTIVIDPPEGHLATYLNSLNRLLDEPMTTLCPAHGPAARDGQNLVRDYITHREEREQALIAALGDAPRTVADLVPEVYWNTPEKLHHLAARSLVAGLHKLVDDGVAEERDGGWRRPASA